MRDFRKPKNSIVDWTLSGVQLDSASQNWEEFILASSCLSVRPSFRKLQLGSHWTNFHEIRDLSIFRKSLQKIQYLLKSGEIKGNFT
jgi:hypothetical protein